MARHRKRRKSATKLPLPVLAAAICLVVIIVSLTLWVLNSGPRFPDITYAPTLKWADPAEGSSEGPSTSTKPEVRDNARTPGQPAFSGEAGVSPERMSQEERLSFIGQKYEKLFSNLKNSYEEELGRLVQCSRNDYLAAKKGEKDVSRPKLFFEYYQAGRTLEKECDQRFNGLLDNMKKELKMYNLPLDLVKHTEKEYAEQKSMARKDLFVKIARYGE